MITITESLSERLRRWVAKGNTFSVLVDYQKYPELLPPGEAEGTDFSLHSLDELPVGTEVFGLEVAIYRESKTMHHYFRTEQELECDWFWMVLESTLRLHCRGIGTVMELIKEYNNLRIQAATKESTEVDGDAL